MKKKCGEKQKKKGKTKKKCGESNGTFPMHFRVLLNII
jgi:hypothetical protein